MLCQFLEKTIHDSSAIHPVGCPVAAVERLMLLERVERFVASPTFQRLCKVVPGARSPLTYLEGGELWVFWLVCKPQECYSSIYILYYIIL